MIRCENRADGTSPSATRGAGQTTAASEPTTTATRTSDPKTSGTVTFRIQILSDLHIDVWSYAPLLAPDVDVVLVAGDVCSGPDRAMRWLSDAYGTAGVPVVAVLGNHEFYGHDWHDVRSKIERESPNPGSAVVLLEDDTAYIRKNDVDLRICACSLWTDLLVRGPKEGEEASRRADSLMNDYVRIRAHRAALRPEDTVAQHQRSRLWLEERLAKSHDGPTVVMTHHAPHPLSLDPEFRQDGTDPFFASDLGELIARHSPDVWVHGHVHRSLDYRLGQTRVVANPRGYPGERTDHDPSRVIEVAAGTNSR